MRQLSAAFAATLMVTVLAPSASGQRAKPHYLDSLADISVFLKPRFDSPNQWDQQFGIRAKLARDGNFSAEYSIAYDPNYPIKYSIFPKWTTSIQFAYFFTRAPIPIAVYTAPKYNLVDVWKQEFGLNFRLLDARRVYVNSSIDDQLTFPYTRHSVPTFQASLTLGFPLGG